MLFNPVKDLFKQFENRDRAVNVLREFENEKFFDLAAPPEKDSILCQILSSKLFYIVFQHNLFFNIFKGFFKWFDNLKKSVNVLRDSESERSFNLAALR